jgi:recombination protein RecA
MDKSLEDLFKQVEKKYGKGALIKMDTTYKADVESISTGSIALDKAIGIGGIPRGRVTEIYGKDASGKTSLTLSLIKEVQALGGTAVFIDAEHSLDSAYATTVGVDINSLFLSQPDSAEEALDILDMTIASGKADLIVIDSVASLVPKAEVEGDIGDSTIGLQARLMSKALRKLSGPIQKSNTAVVFINQVRQNIQTFGHADPVTTSGGIALKFYASVRIQLQRIKTIQKPNSDPVGTVVRATIKKNKVAAPYKRAEFKIFFDEGVSITADILDTASQLGIINKAGAWINYKDYKWQGEDNARKALMDDNKLLIELKEQIISINKE